jgi:hypothetical protein
MSDFFGAADSHGSSEVSQSQFTVAQGGDANSLVPDSTTRAHYGAAQFNPAPRTSNAAALVGPYCELLKTTFTQARAQNWGSLSCNVIAVAQDYQYSGSTLAGPAYLLCGLSDKGYMYEVGLSWDFPLPVYTPGWNAYFNVYDKNGYQLPGGALLVYLPSVRGGDNVALSLSFSGGMPAASVIATVEDLTARARRAKWILQFPILRCQRSKTVRWSPKQFGGPSRLLHRIFDRTVSCQSILW